MRRRSGTTERPGTSGAARLALALLALTSVAGFDGATAQQVRLRGVGEPDFDTYLLRVVAERDYVLVSSDTTIAVGDSIDGPLLVLDARLSIAGTVLGDIVAVDANVFVRPTGRVEGDLWNLGGGLYPSDLAVVTGTVRDHPVAPYRVDREGDLLAIVGTAHESAFRPDGLYGVGLPSYDRVDGVSVPIGASALLPPLGRVRPTIAGRVVYRSERGAWDGGGFLELARGRTAVRFGAERTTATPDRWIRRDLYNSMAFLFAGNDLRDYYRSDRYYARIGLTRAGPEWQLEPYLLAQREDASRLRPGDPWTLFDPDSVRPNRAVVAAAVNSAIAGTAAVWERDRSRLDFAVEVEVGVPTENGPVNCTPGLCPTLGDSAARALFEAEEGFARVTADGAWVSPAFADHTLRARWHLQTPLGGDALPLRRWSHVGGPGTLPTLADAERQGDRVVLVETGYAVPLPFALPILGPADIEVTHLFGGAWAEGGDDSLDQNIGARLIVSLGWVRVTTDPTDFGEDVVVDFGVTATF